MTSTDLIPASTTAKILGHAPRTVKRMAERGEIPHELRLANGAYLFSLAKIREIARAKAEEARARAELEVSA